VIRERAEEALKRAETATPGPWAWRQTEGVDWHGLFGPAGMVHSDGSACGEYGADIDVRGPDAAFIASARADVPDFAAALLRLTGPEMREQLLGALVWRGSMGDLVTDIMDLLLTAAEGTP